MSPEEEKTLKILNPKMSDFLTSIPIPAATQIGRQFSTQATPGFQPQPQGLTGPEGQPFVDEAGAAFQDEQGLGATPASFDRQGAALEAESRGEFKLAADIRSGGTGDSKSSRFKFGNVTTDGRIIALDTAKQETVVFDNPNNVTIDRPFFSIESLGPGGEKKRTFGPRGEFSRGLQTVKTGESPTEKAAFAQRGARAVIGSARKLVDQLWTAKGNTASRLAQASKLQLKSITQSDPRVARYEAMREGFLAPIIRALGEKGTLAEGDTSRARALWPKFTDSREVAIGKLDQIENIWNGVLSGKFNTLDAAITSNPLPSSDLNEAEKRELEALRRRQDGR
jgi:hypothetical protein